MSEEKEIIRSVLKGDEKSCEKILNLYKGRIFSYILRMVKNYDDAEELTLETFIKFFKSIKSYDPTRSLLSWLFTIAHNLVIDFFRRNKIVYEELDEKHLIDADVFEKYEKEQKLKEMERALQAISPIDRALVILFHRERLSYDEMSKILNQPVTTIKTRLHRARKRLRSLLTRMEKRCKKG